MGVDNDERAELLHQLRIWNRQIIANGFEPPLPTASAALLDLRRLRDGVSRTADFLIATFDREDR